MLTRDALKTAAPVAAIAVALGTAAINVTAGAMVTLVVVVILSYRRSVWIAACAVAWFAAFLAVLFIPGPYDSWAGRAAIPVLTVYTGLFLAAWGAGRYLHQRRFGDAGKALLATAGSAAANTETTDTEATDIEATDAEATGAVSLTTRARSVARASGADASIAVATRTEARPAATSGSGDGADDEGSSSLRWPSEFRMRMYLLVMLVIAIVAAVLRFWGRVPPLFAANPDISREVLRYSTNIYLGLLWEAWTIGACVSLFRLLAGPKRGRWLYALFVALFIAGSSLGASKNSVLVGIATAMIAAISVRLRRGGARKLRVRKSTVILVLIGIVAIGTAVYLGGQRTLSGTGNFEDQFRDQFGNSAVAATVGSFDLSLSSSTETFGRLWAQEGIFEPGYGRYSLIFSGKPGHNLFDAHSDLELYYITSQLSQPYYMNTATFVAIPLLDFGRVGAALFLILIGLLVGLAERRFEFSASPGWLLGRATIIYYAAFGIYELYPLVQPIWLATIPGLWALHLLAKRPR